MYNKKQSSKPLFAEVKVAGDADRHPSSASEIQRRENRIPYIKLTYPNGVTLILPTTLDGKNGVDCYSKNGHAVTVLTRQS